MCESAEGTRIAATRQGAGALRVAATGSAAVIVVLGSESERSCSQGSCAKLTAAVEMTAASGNRCMQGFIRILVAVMTISVVASGHRRGVPGSRNCERFQEPMGAGRKRFQGC